MQLKLAEGFLYHYNYIEHKEKLINLIKHRMDNYTSFYPSVVDEADKLSEEYFSCTSLLQKINT